MDYGCLLHEPRRVLRGPHRRQSGLAVICGQYTGWGGACSTTTTTATSTSSWPTATPITCIREEAMLARNDGKGQVRRRGQAIRRVLRRKVRRPRRGLSATSTTTATWTCWWSTSTGRPTPAAKRRRQPEQLADGDRCKLPNGKSDAIGARVTVTAGELTQIHDLMPVTRLSVAVRPAAALRPGQGDKGRRGRDPLARRPQHDLKDVPANQFLTRLLQDRSDAETAKTVADAVYADDDPIECDTRTITGPFCGLLAAAVAGGRWSVARRRRPRQPSDSSPSTWACKVCGKCHEGQEHGRPVQPLAALEARQGLCRVWPRRRPSRSPSSAASRMEPQQSAMCLGCHATGAEAEEWERTRRSHVEDGVQCEKCHGPGQRVHGRAR